MFILLAALVVAVVLWLVLKPGWAPKPPDTSKWTGKASQASKDATGQGKPGVQASDWQSRRDIQGCDRQGRADVSGLSWMVEVSQRQRDLAKQFKQWVAEGAPAKRVDLYNTLPASAEGFAIWLGATFR